MMAETEASASATACVGRRRALLPTFSSFLLASLLAISLQIIFFSPISPQHPLGLPSPSTFPPNNKLQQLTKLGEGFLKDPEDICVDKQNILYTSNRDGWIKRLHTNGTWENWKYFHSRTLLGITTSNSKEAEIFVCDTEKGLLKVTEDGFSILASSSHVNGTKIISFADDVVEAADGSLYFSDASTKFGLHNWYLDYLEAMPHGRLLKYDPSSNQTSIVLDHLYFPNGVAVSADKDYLILCETFKYRCIKYWLEGENKGHTEIFVDNLPGAPDNINLAPDGSFWIALIQLNREGFEWAVRSTVMRHIIATFPTLFHVIGGTHKRATVVKVAADGTIVTKLDEPTGRVISFVTTALEWDGHLYLGTLSSDFIGKLPLNVSH